jgi:hypothetical protein
MAAGQGQRAHDHPRCSGHPESQGASGTHDVLNEYKGGCDQTQDQHGSSACHKIGNARIDADGREKNHQQAVARRKVEVDFEVEN